MLEPVVQDYIRACTELDKDAFCMQVGGPVLISKAAKKLQTFQLAATDMHFDRDHRPKAKKANLSHQLPVLELRKDADGPSGQIGVGRAEENTVVINDETVSQQHAVLFRDTRTDITMLQDLESTNGTTINGKLLVPGRAVELRDGDRISFGDSLFIFYTAAGLYDTLDQMINPPIE
ncbi:MAG: FHA domain-containing protein [Deltaproteobacteria bacterium]|nr:FHA domain-containing protein [Deltaproteobacteria bacterium]MBW1871650.1 FHA domain-containing protein [Deltaproteobacteria bacterium]